MEMSDKKKKMKRSRLSSEESNSSSASSSLSSSEEEIDSKDLKPIKEYLPNRKELSSQIFKSVKADKIRMMLPQTLKKIDLEDLEELCSAELTGMSKARIMSIINGQEMLQSSDTDESDDSGPSLEIVSDTEWLSEEDNVVKVEGAHSKSKKENKKIKRKLQDEKKDDLKSKLKGKGKIGKVEKPNVKVKVEKIKTENKEKVKAKEGESLLDLLELEMRARAIRALIRKEEDSSNSNVKTVQGNSANVALESDSLSDTNAKARQANLKEQLEKIDVLMKHGEDEDVYVVIQSAPTIELLSSESENDEQSRRINQKLVNERVSESEPASEKVQLNKDNDNNIKEKVIITENEDDKININKEKSKDKIKDKDKDKSTNGNANINLPPSVIEYNEKLDHSKDLQKESDIEEGEIVDDDEKAPKIEQNAITNTSPSRRKIKKVKRNPHIRSKRKSKDDNTVHTSNIKNQSISEIKVNSNQKDTISNLKEPIEIEESPERKTEAEKVIIDEMENKEDIFDDKALDIEEIINLDDYPDDIEDLEINETTSKDNKATTEQLSDKVVTKPNVLNSETWTTRYYKQDDVQNVIKESKIQSEIRKRLRERQRQNKMNSSPSLKEQNIQSCTETPISKPTGSVEEYLALKGVINETNNQLLINSSLSITEKETDSSEIKNTVMQYSSTIVKQAQLFRNTPDMEQCSKILNENSSIHQIHKIDTHEDSAATDAKSLLQQTDECLNENKPIAMQNVSLHNDQEMEILNKLEEFHEKLQKSKEKSNLLISNPTIDNLPDDEILNVPQENSLLTKSTDEAFVQELSTEDNVLILKTDNIQESDSNKGEINKLTEESTITDSETSELKPD